MKTIAYTNNQDQQILLRAVQMGIQPYLQQRSPHLLLHHDRTQDHPPEKRVQTVLIPETLKQGSQLFSHFSIEKFFYFKKFFLYL